MEGEAARRRERFVHRNSRQLVPKGDAAVLRAEHARREALVDRVRGLTAHGEDERRVERRRRDRGGLDDGSRVRAQARDASEHDVAHGVGDLVAAGREQLGHVERVARRQPVEGGRVDVVPLRELRDGGGRQRRNRQAATPLRRSRARRARSGGDGSGRARRRDTSRSRGTACRRCAGRARGGRRASPRRPSARPRARRRAGSRGLRGARRATSCAPGSAPIALEHRLGRVCGDLEERPERARRQQRIAAAPEDACGAGELGAEPPCERGLSRRPPLPRPAAGVRCRRGRRRALALSASRRSSRSSRSVAWAAAIAIVRS